MSFHAVVDVVVVDLNRALIKCGIKTACCLRFFCSEHFFCSAFVPIIVAFVVSDRTKNLHLTSTNDHVS